MNSTIKSQWITALRSGDYTQGRKRLRQDNAYCCLGVLCDLHNKANPDDGHYWHDEFFFNVKCYSYGDVATELPDFVQRWAGIDGPDPDIVVGGKSITLAHLNDRGDTFEEIAQRIEEHF